MKYGLVLALCLIGCSCQPPQPQAKRVWVMSEMYNHEFFTVKEDSGSTTLTVLHFCGIDSPVGMWQGLHADVVILWDDTRDCYHPVKITPLN